MQLHLDSPATRSRRNLAVRSNPVRLSTLALAVVFTSSQLPAQDVATTPPAPTQQTADERVGSATTTATNATIAASALPDAPVVSAASAESASVTMPPNVRAMLDDATQRSQSMAAPKSKGVQRPGMLVMGIAGLPLVALGTWIYAAHGDAGARAAFGSLFFVPGALMSGFGFHYAFKPKTN